MKDLLQNPEIFRFSRIATIKSGYPDKFGVPRQSGLVNTVSASIIFEPSVQPEISLEGLSECSHLWVVFVFHLNQNKGFHAKVHPPRLQGESIGVFATRSPHRPNPIGLSLVKIKKVLADRIDIEGVDLVDGTPVLDVKPYLPQYEIRPDAVAGWVEANPIQEIDVEFSEGAQAAIIEIEKHISHFRQAIIDVVKQDPRPVIYRGSQAQTAPEEQPKYRQEHVFRLYDFDVWFRFLTASHVQVFKVVPFESR